MLPGAGGIPAPNQPRRKGRRQAGHHLRWLGGLIAHAGLMVSDSAQAHVKRCENYDLSRSPLPIGEVVTSQFVYFFLGSVVLIYVFFWFDRYVYRKRILEDVLRRLTVTEPVAFMIMRGAALIFFATVSVYVSTAWLVGSSFSPPS
jgi:hypothetical protein